MDKTNSFRVLVVFSFSTAILAAQSHETESQTSNLMGILATPLNGTDSQSSVNSEAHLLRQFDGFMVEYGKSYNSLEEKMRRFQNFKTNLLDIAELNAKETGDAVYGVNQFTDMTHEEFLGTYTGLKIPEGWEPASWNGTAAETEDRAVDQLSGEAEGEEYFGNLGNPIFDWRANNKAYPSADNQGTCGSCWAFSCTGIVDILDSKRTGRVTKYSKQQLVDCVKESNGCKGGTVPTCLKFMQNPGIANAGDYRYKAVQQACPKNLRTAIKIKSFELLSGAAKMVGALPRSPISVSLNCAPKEFMAYKSGIISMDPKQCPSQINHSVILIGHGADYWILRNSWGEGYGERGHFKLKKGLCGIEMYPFAVTL